MHGCVLSAKLSLSPSYTSCSNTLTHSSTFLLKPHPESPSSREKIYTVVVLQVHHKSSALKPLYLYPLILTIGFQLNGYSRKKGGMWNREIILVLSQKSKTSIYTAISNSFKTKTQHMVNGDQGEFLSLLCFYNLNPLAWLCGACLYRLLWAWRGQPRPEHWNRRWEEKGVNLNAVHDPG